MEHHLLLGKIVSAGGGQITGRVRLQKVFYLLDQLGLNSGLSYSYHHYGPYSAELTAAIADAKAFHVVEETIAHRATDGVGFSVYKLAEGYHDADASCCGELSRSRASSVISQLQTYSATALEIAATIHWLRNVEEVSDWQAELTRRKGVKAQGGRMEEALRLLQLIGLDGPQLTR